VPDDANDADGAAVRVRMRPTVIGSGREATDSRTVGAFARVSIEDGLTAVIRVGPRAFSLTGDDNVLAHVEAVNNGSTLIVRLKNNTVVHSKVALKVEVTNDQLEGITPAMLLTASGASTITALARQSFTVQLAAASRLKALGEGTVSVTTSGGSSVEKL